MNLETQVEPVPRTRSRSRIGLPLCIGVSFALHAGLMAMSSVWMSGGVSLARDDAAGTAQRDDEELDTIAIYVRIPAAGGAGQNAARGLAGGKLAASDSSGVQDMSTVQVAIEAPDDGNRASAAAARDLPAEPVRDSGERTLEANEALKEAAPVTADRVASPNELENPPASSGVSVPPFGALLPSAPLSNGAFTNPPAMENAVALADPIGGSNASAGSSAAAGSSAGVGPSTGSAASGQGTARDGNGRGEGGDGAAEPGAVLTFGPRPEYPANSVRHGEEGRVLCEIHIDATGRVTRVGVLQSSGYPRLDQAALDGLAKWRFVPARRDGRAVACRVPHCVTFRLE